MRNLTTTILAIIALTITANTTFATPVYTAGPGHIGLAEEDGLGLHFHAHNAIIDGIEYESYECEADEITILVPETAINGNVWKLPQDNTTGLPFMGIVPGEAESGTYVNDTINLYLTGVVSTPAGGEFILSQTDSFDNEVVLMSTLDGISDADIITMTLADHGHYNWTFTQAGIYELQFEAAADLTAGGSDSSIATFTFEVVPEPATVMLLLSGAAILRKRRI